MMAEGNTVGKLPGTDPIGGALRELASREDAPAELDLLMEPLRLAEPSPPLVRPALRWAAAAAALVALALWLPALLRDTGAPPVPAASAPGAEHEYYKLHPLPEGHETGEPGIVAHLLRETPPDPAEAVGTPPPLEIIGPADEPPGSGPFVAWTLEVAGRRVSLAVPQSVERIGRHIDLTLEEGRVVSATGEHGRPLPEPLLEALVSVKLDRRFDGRFPARLTPPRSSSGSSGR